MNYAEVIIKANYTFFYYHQLRSPQRSRGGFNRHLYKEGAREISANIENKDDTPYLIKSWVEAPGRNERQLFYGDASTFPSGGKANEYGACFS